MVGGDMEEIEEIGGLQNSEKFTGPCCDLKLVGLTPQINRCPPSINRACCFPAHGSPLFEFQ